MPEVLYSAFTTAAPEIPISARDAAFAAPRDHISARDITPSPSLRSAAVAGRAVPIRGFRPKKRGMIPRLRCSLETGPYRPWIEVVIIIIIIVDDEGDFRPCHLCDGCAFPSLSTRDPSAAGVFCRGMDALSHPPSPCLQCGWMRFPTVF